MTPEHFTAQKMKKAYYLTQKIPDQVGDLFSLQLPTALSQTSEAPGRSAFLSRSEFLTKNWDLVIRRFVGTCIFLEKWMVVTMLLALCYLSSLL